MFTPCPLSARPVFRSLWASGATSVTTAGREAVAPDFQGFRGTRDVDRAAFGGFVVESPPHDGESEVETTGHRGQPKE